MPAILGIDAAWTTHAPSGVALIETTPAGWHCVAVAPSYAAFSDLAQGIPVAWDAPQKGTPIAPDMLLPAAEQLLQRAEPITVIAVDMPIARIPIVGYREADRQLSAAYSSRGCSVHSPTPTRPGSLSEHLRDSFTNTGFCVATSQTPVGTPKILLEVYPHPALLSLLQLSYRFAYKVSKSRRYWPHLSLAERFHKLLDAFQQILQALQTAGISNIALPLPSGTHISSLAHLKRYEDALDALVCAWVGSQYLIGRAHAYGDHIAAIWVPSTYNRLTADS